jgi:hypothetical protein
MAKNKTVVAATCRSCDRELKINPHDKPEEALKRNRWSNINLKTKTGVCRSCGKKGLR